MRLGARQIGQHRERTKERHDCGFGLVPRACLDNRDIAVYSSTYRDQEGEERKLLSHLGYVNMKDEDRANDSPEEQKRGQNWTCLSNKDLYVSWYHNRVAV